MTSTNSIFDRVIDWFLGRAGDRRQYKRRDGAFRIWWQRDPLDPANVQQGVGLELSPNGLMFLIDDVIDTPKADLLLRLDDHTMPARVNLVRNDSIEHQGKIWNRYMGEFAGLAAGDWDTIARYVNDERPRDRRRMQNQQMTPHIDDAYHLLPISLQKNIIELLVAQHKLERPPEGENPFLKLFYGGLAKRDDSKPAHRFNAHSRISINDDLRAYDTRFLITPDSTITII